jgi:four helix bundle protein
MKTYPFENLGVWHHALELVRRVFGLVRKLPKTEMFGISDQMRRAAVSVALNIAEGKAADTDAEFRRFLGISRKSLVEVVAALKICRSLDLFSDTDVDDICSHCDRLQAQLISLRKTLQTKPSMMPRVMPKA